MKYKKYICIVLSLIIFLFSGCVDSAKEGSAEENYVNGVHIGIPYSCVYHDVEEYVDVLYDIGLYPSRDYEVGELSNYDLKKAYWLNLIENELNIFYDKESKEYIKEYYFDNDNVQRLEYKVYYEYIDELLLNTENIYKREYVRIITENEAFSNDFSYDIFGNTSNFKELLSIPSKCFLDNELTSSFNEQPKIKFGIEGYVYTTEGAFMLNSYENYINYYYEGNSLYLTNDFIF